MDRRRNLGFSRELHIALQACFTERTEAQIENDVNDVRNYILLRDRIEEDPNVRVNCNGLLLRVMLASLLLRRAELQGVPFEGYQEMSRLVRSVEGLMEDLDEAPAMRANRQIGGEASSEAGPMTEVQRAMPSASASRIATRPVAGLMDDLNESPEHQGNRQAGGEETLEAGPMTDIQRAMPSNSASQIATGSTSTGRTFMHNQHLTAQPGFPQGIHHAQNFGIPSAHTLWTPQAAQTVPTHLHTNRGYTMPPPRRNALVPGPPGARVSQRYQAVRDGRGYTTFAPVRGLRRPTLSHMHLAPSATTHGGVDQTNLLGPFLPDPGMFDFNVVFHNDAGAAPVLPGLLPQHDAHTATSMSGLSVQPVSHIDPRVLHPMEQDVAQPTTEQSVEPVAPSFSGVTLTGAERARRQFQILSTVDLTSTKQHDAKES